MMRVVLCILFFSAMPVSALLPPDAGARRAEILNYREREKARFLEERLEHEEQMIYRHERTQQAMIASPWAATTPSGGVLDAMQGEGRSSSRGVDSGRRRLVNSLTALFLIGIGVWVVKRKTTQTE